MRRFYLLIIVIFILALSRPVSALPRRFDLREQGRVTDVKNQGIPGPCWAFAALGACESSYLTQGLTGLGRTPDLSEMHLAWFVYKDSERFTPQFHGGGALRQEGNVFKSAALLSRLGPIRERDLPYSLASLEGLRDGKKRGGDYAPCLRLREVCWLALTGAPSQELRKHLIMEKGAIVVSLYNESRGWRRMGDDYAYYNPWHGQKTTHDVILVGWDDDCPLFPEGAWLARDSWGLLLGHSKGWFWISYRQHLAGGAAFVVGEWEKGLRHYGHDDLGWCGSAAYKWAANVFQVQGRGEILKEAAFYTPENDVRYEISVYGLGENPQSPVEGPLLANASGTIEVAGYHTVALPPVSVMKGEHFSVVLKLSAGDSHPVPMPVECGIPGYSENCVVHPGESYFSQDGIAWKDGENLSMNACIKAFSVAPYPHAPSKFPDSIRP